MASTGAAASAAAGAAASAAGSSAVSPVSTTHRRLGSCFFATAVPGCLQLGWRDALLAGLDPGGDRLDDERAGTNRIVVAGDHELGLIRIAVRVDERDHGQAEPARLADGELLLLEIDDEDRVRLAAHVGDPAQIRLELLELGLHLDALLGRKQAKHAVLLQAAQFVQALDAIRDRAPVRQQPAEPAVVDVRHANAARLVADGVLRLLLRADEEDGAAALGDRLRKVVRVIQKLLRLGEVDDVDPAALVEDESLHLRVPAACLVAEMNSGLQELLHGDNGHGCPFLVSRTWLRRGLGGSRHELPATVHLGVPTGSREQLTGAS